MIENTAQPVGARAIAQYTQSQAASGQAQGLFSAALETAMARETAQDAEASTAAKDKSAFSLADFAPLLLSGLSEGSENGLLLLLMAMLGGGESGGLLNGLGGALGDSASLPGGLGDIMGSVGSFFGGSQGGGLGGASGGSPSAQATMAAAQSLFKAYQGAAQSGQGAAAGASAAESSNAVGSNKAPGRAVAAGLLSYGGNRSAALYRSVIDQFDVENNPRYAVNQKGTGDTYCNIFLWDVTAAMGAEIPHHTDRDTGAPAVAGAENTLRMNANRISDWLNTLGPQYGWHEVSAEQAQALANRGSPAVAVWKNQAGGHGHVQVVSPSEDGAYDPDRGVAIAQAGRLLRNYTYISKIYSSRMEDVQYFAHK